MIKVFNIKYLMLYNLIIIILYMYWEILKIGSCLFFNFINCINLNIKWIYIKNEYINFEKFDFKLY